VARDGLRVAVVGGGIAGLATAAALARAGVGCTVHEQAERLTEVGAGLQLAPNAVRALRGLGVDTADRLAAVRIEAVVMRRWEDGRVLGVTPLGAECERRYGAPYHAVHRADLQSALLDLVPAADLRLGSRCAGVTAEGAPSLSAAGEPAEPVDLVVGADGIHSVVRDRIAADTPRYCGNVIYRGLVPAERAPRLRDAAQVQLFLGPGRHVVVYPVAGGTVLNFGATVPVADPPEESWSAPGRVEDLLAAYRGWHPDVLALFAATDSVRRWALHDRDAIPRWHDGRVALVGDAAHPMLPFLAQGANQAIEDAVVLADCLAGVARDGVGPALARYEALREPRTARIHRRSRDNDLALHLPDGDRQARRDRALADGMALSSQDWLYGYDAAGAA
jgi:2-polyprenyl-6-methoxyphenol hydroxylase-like FAD-dependent oxidoreductase